MNGYHSLNANRDMLKLWEVCNYFEEPVQIVTMNQAPDPFKNGLPKLTLYISGEGLPMVKIVFSGVIFWKIDNAPICAPELGANKDFRLIRFWHEHSIEEEKTKTTSWILAQSVKWKCVKDQSG